MMSYQGRRLVENRPRCGALLGCHGTDCPLARRVDEWRAYLTENPESYPARPEIEAIARRHGAFA